MAPYRPRKISARSQFILDNLKLSVDELVDALKAAGLRAGARRDVQRDRWRVSQIAARRSKLPKKARKASAPRVRSARVARPIKLAPTTPAGKLDELRRLVFELGYDAARGVFAEFQTMHERMRR